MSDWQRSVWSRISSLRIIDRADLRLRGQAIADELARLRVIHLTVDLGRASLRRAAWLLPIIDAMRAALPRTTCSVVGRPAAADLVRIHLEGSECELSTPTEPALLLDLDSQNAPRAQLANGRLVVPSTLARDNTAVTHVQLLDAALTAGLDVKGRGRLTLPSWLRRAARREIRRRLAGRTGPIVVLATQSERGLLAERVAQLAQVLEDRLGAVAIPVDAQRDGVAFGAATLALGALCIGGDPGWLAVAVALGVPTVQLAAVRSGSRSTHAVIAAPCRLPRAHHRPAEGPCLRCLRIEHAALPCERLAATRWPWDRLARWVP